MSFAISFMHLKLRRKGKEDLHEGEKKQGRDWITR